MNNKTLTDLMARYVRSCAEGDISNDSKVHNLPIIEESQPKQSVSILKKVLAQLNMVNLSWRRG